jgi:hypothetical protein
MILTQEEINKLPHASKTNHSKQNLSDKYEFGSTLKVASQLVEYGWKIVNSYQRSLTKKTNLGNYDYARHWITFRKEETIKNLKVDDVFPQIYLQNSHDGTTALKFESGLFRLVCSNGLVTPSKQLVHLKLRHSKEKISQLNEFLNLYLDTLDSTVEFINDMSMKYLNQDEKLELAKLSTDLRWGQHVPKIELEKVLQVRRQEDSKEDLWTVFNVVQENLTKGGIMGQGSKITKSGEIKKIKTRKLIDENKYVSFNSDMWQLALNKLKYDKWILN